MFLLLLLDGHVGVDNSFVHINNNKVPIQRIAGYVTDVIIVIIISVKQEGDAVILKLKEDQQHTATTMTLHVNNGNSLVDDIHRCVLLK